MEKKYCDFCKPTVNPEGFRFNEPWYHRLAYTSTLTTTRKYYRFRDCEAPEEFLERKLRGTYNQHRDWNKNAMEAAIQPETCIGRHGRIMHQKMETAALPKVDKRQTFRYWENPGKANPYKIDNSITGVHLQETNGGYNRQPDGGFFSI